MFAIIVKKGTSVRNKCLHFWKEGGKVKMNRRILLVTGERTLSTGRTRRIRQLRRRLLMTCAMICFSLLLGFSCCSFLAKAQARKDMVSYKYFTSILIQPGDTLYSIAQQYADGHYASIYDYVEEICLTNHLLDDKIYAGNYLIIPYYSTEFK